MLVLNKVGKDNVIHFAYSLYPRFSLKWNEKLNLGYKFKINELNREIQKCRSTITGLSLRIFTIILFIFIYYFVLRRLIMREKDKKIRLK